MRCTSKGSVSWPHTGMINRQWMQGVKICFFHAKCVQKATSLVKWWWWGLLVFSSTQSWKVRKRRTHGPIFGFARRQAQFFELGIGYSFANEFRKRTRETMHSFANGRRSQQAPVATGTLMLGTCGDRDVTQNHGIRSVNHIGSAS